MVKVMYFSSKSCIPCKTMSTVVEKLEEEYGDRVNFERVDVDKDGWLASEFYVMAIPTIIVLKDHSPMSSFTGLKAKSVIESAINKVLL